MHCAPCRVMLSNALDKSYLRSISVESSTFFRDNHRFGGWLPGLSQLRCLDLMLQLESVPDFLRAAPTGLLALRLTVSDVWAISCQSALEGVARLTNLEVSAPFTASSLSEKKQKTACAWQQLRENSARAELCPLN